MAGPSVMVRILGDVTGLGKSFTDAGAKGESAAAKLHTAFSGALGALNQTGILGPFGEALDGVDRALETITEHGKNVGLAMVGVGTAMAGVGVGLSALGSKDQAAHQQLQASVEATGASYDDYGKKVDEAVKHQERFGDSSAQTQDALNKLTEATHDPQKALDLLGTATNVAAAKHESLTQAATDVGKVFNGNTKLLKEFGVVLPPTTKGVTDHSAALGALAKVTAGQAAAASDTFTGKLDALKAHFEDMAATLGQKYGPALTAVGSVMAGVGAAVQVVTALHVASVAGWLADAAAAAAAAVAENVALLGIPVLIAAVVAGIAWMVTHWNRVKEAVMDVWQWIVDHWPILLAVLLGPFGVLVDVIVKNMGTVKAVAADAVNFIVGLWNSLIGFFSGLPGRLAGIFTGMWHGIYDSFRAVINGIIDLWNQLHFTLPKIDVLGVHVGGETIGVPSIPHLAQGGLITQTGLVYAHAGEAITPADKVPRGPLVQINGGATFNSATDVDMLTKKIEFATQAGFRLTGPVS